MSSIIIELQRDAIDSEIAITNLLRKALVVAKKLDIQEFVDWIYLELNGYTESDSLPNYREVSGEVMVHNPLHGWERVIFQTESESKLTSIRPVPHPISQIENLCEETTDDSVISYPLSDRISQNIMKNTMGMVPYFIANDSQMRNILESVRNIVLDWSLKMESEGIMGEDLNFTEQEKEKAESIINIENFSGIIGDISSSNIQIGNYNSIHSELKKLGVSQNERNELEEIMDSYNKANLLNCMEHGGRKMTTDIIYQDKLVEISND